MTPDQERWGAALAVLKRHGDAAQAHAAEQVEHWAGRNDAGGVELWLDIGRKLVALTERETVQ